VPLNQRFQTVLVTLTKRPYGFEVCHLYVLHAPRARQVSHQTAPAAETLVPFWPFKEL
jgi:hypothetical protein